MERDRTAERKTTEDHIISYSLRRNIVEDLVRYAFPVENGTYTRAREINLYSDTACSSLETVEGMVLLHRWFNAFSKTFECVAEFDSQVKRGVAFNHADWRLMDESMEKAINALMKKLNEVAQGA